MYYVKRLFLSLFLVIALSSPTISVVEAQAAPTVAKLAKDFSVSPKLLKKFSKAGLSGVDLGNGLKIAKEVSSVKNLDINDAAEQVLGLKRDGKEWPDIAKQFEIELPKGIDVLQRN